MDIAIIKYNAGNIGSVENAVRRIGIEPVITDDPERITAADRVVFPGQGEAKSTMEYLKAHKLDEVILNLKQPVLGICIGMQLLCRHSEEYDTKCLGVFDVDVKRFKPMRHEDKVPQMGWNTIENTESELFAGFDTPEFTYSGTILFPSCSVGLADRRKTLRGCARSMWRTECWKCAW